MSRYALAAILVAFSAMPAAADCTDEVKKAYEAQAAKPFIRKETDMITADGVAKMVLEYQLPDRMRQTVSMLTDPKPVESIVIGDRAWSQDENGWFELPLGAAEQFVEFRDKSLGIGEQVGKFECLGGQTLDGKEVRAYRGVDEGPKEITKEGDKPLNQNEAVRIVYLDAATGLPERAIYAHKDRLNVPIYKEQFSFPESISIEPPANVQKPSGPPQGAQ